jgi:hypothetical protein
MSQGFLGRARICAVATVTAGAFLMALSGSASAETINVKSAAQLEEAVSTANGNCSANTIVLAAGVYLPVHPLTFTDACGVQTVEGPTHAPEATIDGAAEEIEHPELILIGAGASVTFKDLVVDHAGGSSTAAVEDIGTFSLEASTVGGNRGADVAVQPGASATIRNSTLSDGLASGLINLGSSSVLNSTVAFNATGGVENGGSLNIYNTIVAENGKPNCTGAKAAVNDHNLSSDSSCGAELSGVNPMLGTLYNNGGPTVLRSLQPGSPAIDAGDPAMCTTSSQEGQPRPDEAADEGKCDIGADEWNATAPTITVPTEVTAAATGPTGAKVTYSAGATSAVAGVSSFSCSPKSGSTFAIGETMVTCTAKDGHGNVAMASFKVIVTDKTPPVISGVPANIEKAATSPAGAEVTYTNPTATDIVDGTVPVMCAPASGSTFAIGETTVTCTATDSHGNTAEASFKVTITAFAFEFKEWLFKGSVNDKTLSYTLFNLPAGSTFNGHATIPGELEANTSVPAFTSTHKLFGLISVTFGFTFTETEAVKGTISNDPSHSGNDLVKATAKDKIGVTSISIMGLKIPTSCTTNEAVLFPLEASVPSGELTTKGASFVGETRIPRFTCGGGFLGAAFSPIISGLMSGPSTFQFTIEP